MQMALIECKEIYKESLLWLVPIPISVVIFLRINWISSNLILIFIIIINMR